MFCNQCGARLTPNVAYCTHCGKAVGLAAPTGAAAQAAAAPSAVGRVFKHRNVLGILWIVLGVISLPGGMFMVGFSRFNTWSFGPWNGVPSFVAPLLGTFGAAVLVYSILAIIGGVGLLMVQGWARMLVIVIGIVGLIRVPLGTALGIYTLWVLLPDQSNVEYGQLAAQRVRI